MPNNTVNLNGFLSVAEVKTALIDRKQEVVVRGWIHTAPEAQGRRHPFLATGTPAQVILENARVAGAGDAGHEDPETRFGVTLRAKLVSMPARSFLEIKHISFFDLSNPICLGQNLYSHFTANSVTLQGHLDVPVKNPVWRQVDGIPDLALAGCIHTDADCAGGNHPLLISGDLGEFLLAQISPRKESASLCCPATIGGTLLTIDSTIHVQASYLSIQTEEQHASELQREPIRYPPGHLARSQSRVI